MAILYDADTVMAKEMYRNLSVKEKISYLWEYYYRNVFFGVIALIIIIVFIYTMRPGPEADIRIKFINVSMESMTEENDYSVDNQEICLDEGKIYEMSATYSDIDSDNEIAAGRDLEGLLMEMIACNLELLIYDELAMNKICPTGWVLDLSTCMDDEMLKKVQDNLVYHVDENGNTVPMAIDITETNYVKNEGIKGERIYLSFVANSPNEEYAKQYVAYILSQ